TGESAMLLKLTATNLNASMTSAYKPHPGTKESSTCQSHHGVLIRNEENDMEERKALLGSLRAPQNTMGMTVTSGSITITKDNSNLIGISIGGGAPLCPCLYIVQVFDNTPAAKDGTLQSGDELVGVNGASVKGKTKVEVAKMIQACKDEVTINYNKLHADPQQGKTLDIVLKKVKHRLVENMSTATADALGLSRAILCNDTLVKKLEELEQTEMMYRGLVEHAKRVLKAFFDLLQVYKAFGDTFAAIGVREPQPRASEAFRQFGDYHRQMEKCGIKMLKSVKPKFPLNTFKIINSFKLIIQPFRNFVKVNKLFIFVFCFSIFFFMVMFKKVKNLFSRFSHMMFPNILDNLIFLTLVDEFNVK
ncbi:hypothetical protein L9F63_018128, partial [Diploptera punctata]